MTKYDAEPGGRDPGAAVRASMSTCVSDIRMPASLLDRAVRRDHKRKTRIRLSSAAGATAAIAAGATLIASLPARPSSRPAATGLRAHETAAYVLSRAAAAQVNSYHMISVVQSRGGVFYTDVATQQQKSVSALRASSGEPYFQISWDLAGHRWKETDVEYQHHVYSTFDISSFDKGQGSYATVLPSLPLQAGSPDPAIAFSQALKAGAVKVVGHRKLNGRDTILLRATTEKRKRGTPPLPQSLIWIDASSYLVVQVENFGPALPRINLNPLHVILHVSWLAPTQQNLALLTVTPPAGFTKIPYSEMAQKYLGPIS
jgi:hypothetical protein